MSAPVVTFTPEAEDYILSFFDTAEPARGRAGSSASLSLWLVWGPKVTAKDGRVVVDHQDWSLSVSRSLPEEDSVALNIRGRRVHMPLRSFGEIVGRTVYLSHGHSSDISVDCGDLLKVR